MVATLPGAASGSSDRRHQPSATATSAVHPHTATHACTGAKAPLSGVNSWHSSASIHRRPPAIRIPLPPFLVPPASQRAHLSGVNSWHSSASSSSRTSRGSRVRLRGAVCRQGECEGGECGSGSSRALRGRRVRLRGRGEGAGRVVGAYRVAAALVLPAQLGGAAGAGAATRSACCGPQKVAPILSSKRVRARNGDPGPAPPIFPSTARTMATDARGTTAAGSPQVQHLHGLPKGRVPRGRARHAPSKVELQACGRTRRRGSRSVGSCGMVGRVLGTHAGCLHLAGGTGGCDSCARPSCCTHRPRPRMCGRWRRPACGHSGRVKLLGLAARGTRAGGGGAAGARRRAPRPAHLPAQQHLGEGAG